MGKVLCFGELLLRMSPSFNGEWLQKNSMPVFIGGAELNVATALAGWDIPSKYCTALPDNYLSKDVAAYVAARNIDTSSIHYSGKRIGLYFLQQGADLKNAGVIFDRAGSSFATLPTNTVNWNIVLKDVSWLHFTAIVPALSEPAVALCKEALVYASQKGITISIDLNYRARLWQDGRQPADVVPALAQYCDVIMGNIWSAHTLLGTPLNENIHDKGTKEAYLEHAIATAQYIQRHFPKCKTMANTFRFDKGANGIRYYAALYSGNELYTSPEFECDQIIDKVGSGDCFMAGLIYGLYHQYQPQDIINFAAAAAFGKLQEMGDTTNQTTNQVHFILKQYA